ncbi:hypothetical protein BDV96DRAFT_130631 [Lophiotrema nucula]|uniref:F-box domain-containing protein n=1 Tax=Lophiotrema nucula TaxID=690887 RepID=A0A6A5ZSK4_9PLEO|nr:hypothetical protein BDV96DRAFT_130631 [Lophiotrema nucula]
MERLRRYSSPPRSMVANGEGGKRLKKRPSFSNLLSSFKGVRKRSAEDDQGQTSLFFAAFFRLPNELHLHILSNLSIADLLSLRRTCHSFNALVTACGSSLVRYWTRCRFGSLHLKLYPAPGPNQAELQYLLAMRRRHIAAVRLTRELANFVLRDTLKYTNQRQRQMWASVYEKMIPLVFAVGYFLEEHRRAILERDLGRIRRGNIGYDICTTPGITSQEGDILKRLDCPLRLQYYFMYLFIVQVLSRKLRPPTYAGSVERIVRGWTGHAACAEDIAFVLILGGISQVAKLLACKNYSERRRHLHHFITRLSPHQSVAWRGHWRDLGVTSPALLDDIPCASIGITQLDQIWTPMMERLMEPDSREFTEQDKTKFHEVTASKQYINELMGYDILRGRPVDGENEEGEGDDL